MTIRLGGIQKYSKAEKIKFEGTKPLAEYPNSSYQNKFLIQYNEFEEPKEFDRYEAIKGQRIDLGNRKIVFGITAPEEEFTQYDFLWCPDGPAFVVHQRILDRFNELCPSDVQALPMVIKNLDPEREQFENKDFWLINILVMIDAIDQKKSEAYWDGDFLKFRKKMYLKDLSCFDHHKIARIVHKRPWVIFHPSLAKHFIQSRGIKFLTDEESPQ